ncbi:hypothetical protein LCGC14_1635130 [marine sediment metagenome]|uniref:Uncharacterized protein n=1 Tax=marine sediment metagenome TaxID=412755 RepID=A0A0F9KH11_9ZZZZ
MEVDNLSIDDYDAFLMILGEQGKKMEADAMKQQNISRGRGR